MTLQEQKTEVIAELGHNWKTIEEAKNMIWTAKECGASVAKFQLYDITTIKNPGDSHYEELKHAELDRWQIEELANECKRADIEFMASAFDKERVGWLEDIGVKRHKLASRSILEPELIQCMLDTGKPIIASLGAWKKQEFPEFKADFLYCLTRRDIETSGVQNFPLDFVDCVGFSDHTIGIEYAKKAIDRGAKIIEKHFTLDKNMPGCDQAGSMTPSELRELCEYAKN